MGCDPLAIVPMIIVGPRPYLLEAMIQIELLGRPVVDSNLEEHMPCTERMRPFHARTEQVAGDAASTIGRADADGEQLALLTRNAAERKSDPSQGIETRKATLEQPSDQAEAPRHRQQVGQI